MAGRLNHFELTVLDARRASEYFGALFGWRAESQMGGSFYLVDGDPSCGLVSSADGPAPPRLYFSVDDIEAAVDRVRELGGTAEDIKSSPGYGRWCQCRDDQGTAFGLYQKEGVSPAGC